jgi:hypothetical protein
MKIIGYLVMKDDPTPQVTHFCTSEAQRTAVMAREGENVYTQEQIVDVEQAQADAWKKLECLSKQDKFALSQPPYNLNLGKWS